MCSYCGCRDIVLIGQLNAEHDAIVNAGGELARAARTPDTARALRQLAVLEGLLHPHTGLEERGIFAELRRDEEFTEHVDRLCAEHAALEAGLAACRDGDFSGLTDLLHLLREHVEKEENGLFPAAAVALDGDQWERLHADPAVRSENHPHDHDHGHGHGHALTLDRDAAP